MQSVFSSCLARLPTFALKAGYLCHFAVTNCLQGKPLPGVYARRYVLTITVVPRFPTV
jgi:hypothetical protein